jgi:CPA1 family monovalent cation:H+ antiporter
LLIFETVLVLLLGATVLSLIAKRAGLPYPTLLAMGGALVAFVPNPPSLDMPPELILALFAAPVLLDAAHDASLRDLRDTWRPVLWLVLVAVGLTTITVAFVARQFLPDFPWAAAIALGALLSPPDAVAALAVLQHVNPPHRIRKVLEGESLLNDASALLIYKLALGTLAAGSLSVTGAIPTFAIVVFGSAAVGWLLARLVGMLMERIEDAPTSVILQFVFTFGVWLLAERLGLSAVVTIVVFGLTMAQQTTLAMPARLRVSSFAIWQSVTFVLNVLAFTLIGLQIGPILGALNGAERLRALGAAIAILVVVIAVRFVWVLVYHAFALWRSDSVGPDDRSSRYRPTTKSAVVVAWSGMRGIVTLAAALALPANFPHRDLVLLTAFVVVLGTLVIQGLTLRPLLNLLRLPKDTIVEDEISVAREAALKAAITELEADDTPAAQRLRMEYGEAMSQALLGRDPYDTADNALRLRVLGKARRAIHHLRSTGAVGDDAYRLVEEELDWLELSARPRPTAPQRKEAS